MSGTGDWRLVLDVWVYAGLAVLVLLLWYACVVNEDDPPDHWLD